MIARALYLAAQWGHAWPKRHKSSAQRTCAHLAALDGFVQLGDTARVLSLGPRNIDEVEALEAQGWHVEAADLFPTHPRIRRADMERLPWPANRFNLVWASHVFEHAHSQRRAAREIARVVKPGGLVWIAVPRGGEPNPHDRWRFDTIADVVRPFREAGAEPRVAWSEVRPGELRVLLQLWKPPAARRLLVALPDARMVRDWVGSGVVQKLAARHGVVVLVPEALVSKVQEALPGATVERWEPHRGRRWARWLLRWPVRTLSYAIRATWEAGGEAYRHKLELRRARRQRVGAAVARTAARLISALGVAPLAAERAIRGGVGYLPTPRASASLLEALRPDVVVCPTMLHEGSEVPLLLAAKRRQIPIVLGVGSLDTLVSKGALLVRPDRLLVWGQAQRNEARTWHDLPWERIVVTGPPAFDVYGESGPPQPKRTVYLAGSSVQYFQSVAEVKAMLEDAQHDLGVTIDFSPHPRRSGETWDWTGPEIAQRLRDALCLVCAWSTLAIEAALCGTPTLFVAYGQGVPRFGQWPHMRTILQWPDVRICRSAEELRQGIRDLVSGAWRPDPDRLRWVAQEQARADGLAGERIIEAIEEVAR